VTGKQAGMQKKGRENKEFRNSIGVEEKFKRN
jgi:hypothetical protein